MKNRARIATLATLTLCTMAGGLAAAAPAHASGASVYVNCTSGSDSNSGTSGSPWKTLGHAVSTISGSGNTINLVASTSWCSEDVVIPMSKAGTAAAHNSIAGPETGLTKSNRYKAVLSPSGSGTALVVNSNYWDIYGFTVNGEAGYPDNLHTYTTSTSQSSVDSWKDSHQSDFVSSKLIYLGQSQSGVHDVSITDMWASDSGGECVRIRENAYNVTFADSQVQYCGLFKKNINGYDYHNGEGVYVGTSPKSTGEEGYANDTTNNVTVDGNTIWTWGTECGEFKENEHDNFFIFNTCAHSEEPTSSSGSILEVRGQYNDIQNNTFTNANDWGARVAADSETSDTALNNTFESNAWDGYVDAGAKDYISEGSNVVGSTYCDNTAVNPTSTFGSGSC